MPYKSEKIKIQFTKHDRRIKLDDVDRQQIIRKYNQGSSIRSLGREYSVDKKTIKFVIDPEYYKETLAYTRSKKNHLNISKEKRNEYMRNHRHYKQKLYIKGEIKWKQ